MKNFKLLLATTAILSAGALMANAGSTVKSTTLHGRIAIVKPIEITEIYALDFGIVSNISNNQTVVIDLDSDTPSGTATRIDDSITRRGVLGIKNTEGYAYTREGTSGAEVSLRLSVPETMDLSANGISCGTVTLSKSHTIITPSDDEVYVYIGGTYKATVGDSASVIDSSFKGICTGTAEITLVVNS